MNVDRFSITMDPDLGKAVREAAAAQGVSVSAWLGEAALARVRNGLLGEYLDKYEADHGAFTNSELAEAERELGLRPRAPTRRARSKAS